MLLRNNKFAVGALLIGVTFAISACQSDSAKKAADAGAVQAPPPPAADNLAAYCPSVNLRSGTAFYDVYAKGAKKKKPSEDETDTSGQTSDNGDNSNNVVYQASISQVTRSCKTVNGTMMMTIGAAGKVVTGPQGKAGTINMPIRVAVLRGDQVLYSNLAHYPVDIKSTAAATQFIYTNDNVSFAAPKSHDTLVYIGFDPGPEKAAAKKKKKK
ncbi:MAG TPA: hypothetical protein VHC00_05080 [Rhizobiaceae bacterium]|jgi:hypothetical protein|nr:hypothetical protein [Rhizobiaceae bacterium]